MYPPLAGRTRFPAAAWPAAARAPSKVAGMGVALITGGSRIPVGRLGRSEEVADLIAAVIANGYITSQSLLVDGGMHPS